jgi:PhzF family phenazine biosynthesis protein
MPTESSQASESSRGGSRNFAVTAVKDRLSEPEQRSEPLMQRRLQLVDVFSDQPFSGNPLAVVVDADGLSTEDMQRITRWMNLSETAFLLSPTIPEADYRVRIFALAREIPFAGYPTLGSCNAWPKSGGRPHDGAKIIQECGAGLVCIRQSDSILAFAAPPLIRTGPVDELKLEEIARALRIARSDIVDAQWADNGPGWIVVLLETAQAVLDLEPAREHATRLDIGIVGPSPGGSQTAFELRAIFTDHNGTIREDPVTGSLNAAAAQWLLATGRAAAPYTASQGARVGRDGRIYITQDDDGTVWVGGPTTTLFDGNGSI